MNTAPSQIHLSQTISKQELIDCKCSCNHDCDLVGFNSEGLDHSLSMKNDMGCFSVQVQVNLLELLNQLATTHSHTLASLNKIHLCALLFTCVY